MRRAKFGLDAIVVGCSNSKDELSSIKAEKQILESRLNAVNKRISELEKG